MRSVLAAALAGTGMAAPSSMMEVMADANQEIQEVMMEVAMKTALGQIAPSDIVGINELIMAHTDGSCDFVGIAKCQKKELEERSIDVMEYQMMAMTMDAEGWCPATQALLSCHAKYLAGCCGSKDPVVSGTMEMEAKLLKMTCTGDLAFAHPCEESSVMPVPQQFGIGLGLGLAGAVGVAVALQAVVIFANPELWRRGTTIGKIMLTPVAWQLGVFVLVGVVAWWVTVMIYIYAGRKDCLLGAPGSAWAACESGMTFPLPAAMGGGLLGVVLAGTVLVVAAYCGRARDGAKDAAAEWPKDKDSMCAAP